MRDARLMKTVYYGITAERNALQAFVFTAA
jgi:hypothetical protein